MTERKKESWFTQNFLEDNKPKLDPTHKTFIGRDETGRNIYQINFKNNPKYFSKVEAEGKINLSSFKLFRPSFNLSHILVQDLVDPTVFTATSIRTQDLWKYQN